MRTDLYQWITENLDFYPNCRMEESGIKNLQDELGYEFPQDYAALMAEMDGGEISGENNNIVLFSCADLLNHNTDPTYMVSLRGMILIGTDSGGNLYYYDPENYAGKGHFALFWVSCTSCSFGSSKFIAKNLFGFFELLKNSEHSFFNFRSVKEEGLFVKENDPVPTAEINTLQDLMSALPKEINSKRHGQGVLEIKESVTANGTPTISGQYNMKNDLCLFYTFSSSYQGFYDAIAPAIAMEGLFTTKFKQ